MESVVDADSGILPTTNAESVSQISNYETTPTSSVGDSSIIEPCAPSTSKSGNDNSNPIISDAGADDLSDPSKWSIKDETCLMLATLNNKPVGPLKHFQMAVITKKFYDLSKKSVKPSVLYNKLKTWYNMDYLDKMEPPLWDSTIEEFKLPAEYFSAKNVDSPTDSTKQLASDANKKSLSVESNSSNNDSDTGSESDTESSTETHIGSIDDSVDSPASVLYSALPTAESGSVSPSDSSALSAAESGSVSPSGSSELHEVNAAPSYRGFGSDFSTGRRSRGYGSRRRGTRHHGSKFHRVRRGRSDIPSRLPKMSRDLPLNLLKLGDNLSDTDQVSLSDQIISSSYLHVSRNEPVPHNTQKEASNIQNSGSLGKQTPKNKNKLNDAKGTGNLPCEPKAWKGTNKSPYIQNKLERKPALPVKPLVSPQCPKEKKFYNKSLLSGNSESMSSHQSPITQSEVSFQPYDFSTNDDLSDKSMSCISNNSNLTPETVSENDNVAGNSKRAPEDDIVAGNSKRTPVVFKVLSRKSKRKRTH